MPLREYTGFFQPPGVVDNTTLVRGYGVQIAWDLIPDSYRAGAVKVNVTAVAAQNATSIAVTALKADIESGRILQFSATKFAVLTAKAVKGATALSVQPLPVALAIGDVTYSGGSYKQLKALTVLCKANGRNDYIPRALKGTSDGAASCVLFTNAEENDGYKGWNPNDGYSGYGQLLGGVLYENLMPDADSTTGFIPDAYKSELRAVGTGWGFQKSSDSRPS